MKKEYFKKYKVINYFGFQKLFTNGSVIHENYIIDIERDTQIDFNKSKENIRFKNCLFIGKDITFVNGNQNSHSLSFEQCKITNQINFISCKLKNLEFLELKYTIKKINLHNSLIDKFDIHNNIGIQKAQFHQNKYLHLEINITQIYKFSITNVKTLNILLELYAEEPVQKIEEIDEFDEIYNTNFIIANNNFQKIILSDYPFNFPILFDNNTIQSDGSFYCQNCSFYISNFSNNTFAFDSTFNNLNFFNDANFENSMNIDSDLIFNECTFHGNVLFNNSFLNLLSFDFCSFKKNVSIQNVTLNSIFIDRTNFEKNTYLEDLKINNFDNCNVRSIRIIKQLMNNADNKIDYSRFRSYELDLHLKNLNKEFINSDFQKKIELIPDIIPLITSSFFSSFGTNPAKAFGKTIVVGFIFYVIFFITYNCLEGRNQSESFLNGLFRYFILTDFKNPLSNEYLSNWREWIPFLLGKILIAIGLFETITSFRKFYK